MRKQRYSADSCAAKKQPVTKGRGCTTKHVTESIPERNKGTAEEREKPKPKNWLYIPCYE
jgi:hypothetical protein